MLDAVVIINQLLQNALDFAPATQQRLRSMEGRSMSWDIEGWGYRVFFHVQGGRLIFGERYGPTQVTLRASPTQLMQLWRTPDAVAQVSIEGNPLVLRDFSGLLREADVDVEQIASLVVGDSFAHLGGRLLRHVGGEAQWHWRKFQSDRAAWRRDENPSS